MRATPLKAGAIKSMMRRNPNRFGTRDARAVRELSSSEVLAHTIDAALPDFGARSKVMLAKLDAATPQAALLRDVKGFLSRVSDEIANRISRGFEVEIGRQVLREKFGSQQFGASEALMARGRSILGKLLDPSLRPKLNIDFVVFDGDGINAINFAGAIGIPRGAVATLPDGQLAGLIGHEVAHSEQRHMLRAMLFENLGTKLEAMARNVSPALSLRIGAASSKARYRRQIRFEYQADSRALRLLQKAGYEPRELLKLFRAVQPVEDATRAVMISLGAGADHPPIANRLRALEHQILKLPHRHGPRTPGLAT